MKLTCSVIIDDIIENWEKYLDDFELNNSKKGKVLFLINYLYIQHLNNQKIKNNLNIILHQ